MSANNKNCVPRNNEQLSYWPILNFYSEIWRTRKKTKSAFMVHLGFDRDLDILTKVFCANMRQNMSNMLTRYLTLVNIAK
jgi:hypothetical protein